MAAGVDDTFGGAAAPSFGEKSPKSGCRRLSKGGGGGQRSCFGDQTPHIHTASSALSPAATNSCDPGGSHPQFWGETPQIRLQEAERVEGGSKTTLVRTPHILCTVPASRGAAGRSQPPPPRPPGAPGPPLPARGDIPTGDTGSVPVTPARAGARGGGPGLGAKGWLNQLAGGGNQRGNYRRGG